MTNTLVNLGYNYAKLWLNIPPNVIYILTYLVWIVTCNPSRLAWDMALRGRYRYLYRLIPSTAFTGTNNQEVPTNFESSTCFIIWY